MSKPSVKVAELPMKTENNIALSNPTDRDIQNAFPILELCNVKASRIELLAMARKALTRWRAIKRNQTRLTNSGYKIMQPDENLAFISFSKEQEILDHINFSQNDATLPQRDTVPASLSWYGEYEPCKSDVIARFILNGLSLSEFNREQLGVFVGHYVHNTPLSIIQKTAPCFYSDNIWKKDNEVRERIKHRFGLPDDMERIELRPASEDEEALIQRCLQTFLLPYPAHDSITNERDFYETYFDERVHPGIDAHLFFLRRNHLIACPQCYGWVALIRDAKIHGLYTKIYVPTFVDKFADDSKNAISSSELRDSELGLIK